MASLGAVLTVIIGIILIYFLYYLLMVLNWFDQGWQSIAEHIPMLGSIVGPVIIAIGATFFVRRWVQSQLVLHDAARDQLSINKKNQTKWTNLRAPLAFIIILHAGWFFFQMINTYRLISSGALPEEFIHQEWQIWHFTPLITKNIIMVLGAFSLLKGRTITVLFFSFATFLTIASAAYQLLIDPEYRQILTLDYLPLLAGSLFFFAVFKVFPLVYSVYLFRNHKLS